LACSFSRKISRSPQEALTEQRAQRNLAGHRHSPWLSHLAVSSPETPRTLMTPGEVLQADAALVLVSSTPLLDWV